MTVHEQFHRRSTAGGRRHLQLTAKSGTNTLRGSLFECTRQREFGAGIPFTNDGSGKLVRPPNRRNNFGGSWAARSPFRRMRGTTGRSSSTRSEQFRQVETRPVCSARCRPTEMRNGDFSEALTGRVLATDPLGRRSGKTPSTIPRTTRVVNGQVVRDPFPNNDSARIRSTRSR
jgi:hypothetical protein